MSRTFILKFAYAIAAAGAAAGAVANERAMTPQEDLMTRHMAAHGVTAFLMMNEKKGQLLGVENGRIVLSVSALSGKTPGDKVQGTMTPADIFPLTPTDDQRHPDAALTFLQSANMGSYVIHHGPNIQNRPARLKSADPGVKRISNGCINLSDADYEKVSRFAVRSVQTYMGDDGIPRRTAPYLSILNENPDPRVTWTYFGMNEALKPK